MNGKCIRHTSIRKLGAKVPLLCSQPAYLQHHQPHHGHLQHHLTQQPAITNKKTGNESRRHGRRPTPSNITTSASKATSWNHFYRFSHFSGRACDHFSFLHYISAISVGVLTVWSTHIDLGFLCSGLGRRLLGFFSSRSRSLFSFSFLLFIFGFRLEIYITRSMMCAFERGVGRIR